MFRRRHRLWRERVRGRVLLAAFGVFAAIFALALLWPSWWRFDFGLALGGAVAMYLGLIDEPPEHIDRWRRGSGGERRTARALRPLSGSGWLVRHDLSSKYGNRDHVVVGRPGVFLLDSKALGGEARVEAGVLSVRWHEDDKHGYDLSRLSLGMRGGAASLAAELTDTAGLRAWVQPVVVVWASFQQGLVESDGVFYVHGERLADWLLSLPPRIPDPSVTKLASAIADAPRAAA
jgi:hypothetical protein